MKKQNLKFGDLLQINPNHEKYGSQLVMCIDQKKYGCIGILYIDTQYPSLFRFEKYAFVMVRFEDVEYIGHLKWKEEKTIYKE